MVGTGRPNPLDPEPIVQGNVQIAEDGRGVPLSKSDAAAARARGDTLYLSHFATCPDRQQWRDRQLTLGGTG